MDNKRGFALIFCLLVISVLAILSSSIFSQSINENNLVERHIYEKEALWLAEAGLAEAIRDIPNPTPAGSLKQDYNYTVTVNGASPPLPLPPLPFPFYRVYTTGTVTLLGLGEINRSVEAIVRLDIPPSGDFNHAIETTGDLIIKGKAYTITGDGVHDPAHVDAELDFSAVFGVSKQDMRAAAVHLYNEVSFGEPINQITWVDVTPGNTLTIDGDLEGSGILVVQGDAHIAGTVEFSGIIYVIGELRLSGTPDIYGAILAESNAGIDTTLSGNVSIIWSQEQIDAAITYLTLLATRTVVSWREI